MKRSFITIVVSIFLALQVKSQHLYYKTIGLEQGLPSSSVYSLFQDSKGYLWLGTEGGGLSQYSGDKLKTYTLKNGLKGINIRAINEDSRGNIVFGNSAGLHYFNGKQFKTINLSDFNSDIAISSIITFHKAKTIWVATTGLGIYILNETDSGYKEVKHIYSTDHPNENSIFDMDSDANENVWAVHYNGSIHIFNNTGQLIKTNEMPEQELLSIHCQSSKGLVFIGTTKGAYQLQVDKTYNIIKTVSVSNVGNELIYDISSNGNTVLFATEKKGVYYHSETEQVFLNTQNGLPVNVAYKLIADSDGNFWLGTIGGGLVSFQGNAFNFYTKQEGLENASIFNVVRDQNTNDYYLATFGNGFHKLSFNGNSFNIQKVLAKLPDQFITDLTFDNDHNLWFSTKNNGAGYWNGKEVKTISNKNGLLSDNVNCILIDKKNRYWFGTSGGLNLLANGELKDLTTDNGLCNNEVQTLFEDSKGNVWIGTLSGLARYDDRTLRNFDEKDGLLDKTVYSITEDNFGNIWIGTFGGGVYAYSGKGNNSTLKRILSEDDVLSNNIYSIAYNTHRNQLVVGTDKGASVITLNDGGTSIKHITNFVKNNGFIAQETNLNALLVEKNKLFFGTNSGLTVIDLEKLSPSSKEVPLHITDLHLFYKSFLNDSTINRFAVPDHLKFSYNKNHLTFYFEGVSFSNTETLKYSFMLEGQDTSWSPASENKFVTFSSLDPGDYTFKVRIKGPDGLWQKNIQEVKFTIHPPFYLTWWFITLSIILLITSVFLFIRWRELSLKKENLRLESIVTERTKEVVIQKNEAEKQKELVEEKQKEILDSISYAKRLQNAIMPPLSTVKQHLPDSFILYLPKDIVAGDFYCFEKINNSILFAAADCTGHGVPGALVSIVCSNAINNVLKDTTPNTTGIVLDKVRELVLETFSKSESEVKDGMDISMCCIDVNTLSVTWSGANNPLWYISAGELHEIKANKQPIGLTDDPQPFITHSLSLSKGDTIYLFTDGYADQFGGPKGKKFKYKPLQDLLLTNNHLPMEEIEKILKTNFLDWKGDLEQVDDVCIVGIRL